MSDRPPFTRTQWLIVIIAAIGFLFDTYELLMTPLVAVPAIAELLGLPPNHPTVTDWTGRMLWISALCGGIFGLLGGWLIDRFGRKRIMAASIFLYAFSPFAAAFSTTLSMFVFFRCLTFIGVCVEFVAAITWLAELFPDKKQKEKVLGWTQAFASLGGLLVTGINVWILQNASTLPALHLGEGFDPHASWRYLLMTGLIPAIPIAIMLPFVPESPVWRERRAAGTFKRPSFGALFTPELRRTTLVAAALSACAYGAAFGALQITPLRVAPGTPELAEQQKALQPLVKAAGELNKQLDAATPAYEQAMADVPALKPIAEERALNRREFRSANKRGDKGKAGELAARFKELNAEIDKLTKEKPAAKAAVLARHDILKSLGDNRDLQEPFTNQVRARGNNSQFFQEMGGLTGRILLALLLMTAIARGNLLRMFIIPGLAILPLTYTQLYSAGGLAFDIGIFFCGLMVVAQFSYFGEYLPKVFPLHLRGTGGSFATNVGGRMIGTSAAFLTTNVVARWFAPEPRFNEIAMAAAVVGTFVFVVGFALSFLLPQPKGHAEE